MFSTGEKIQRKDTKLNLFYPQWQGGGPDLSTYYGAFELKQAYYPDVTFSEVEVSTANTGTVKKGIFGYDQILTQMKAARRVIDLKRPERIFTIGGGCDAGILPLSYLSELMSGKLTIIWFDAHGDLNSPQSSPSGYFYGMPVRALLGESDPALLELLYAEIEVDQLILCGLRDLDEAESAYIAGRQLTVCRVEEMTSNPEMLLDLIKDRGNAHIYIHLDFDVLDPEDFPYVPLPEPGGLSILSLTKLINSLRENFTLTGLGLFEYSGGSACNFSKILSFRDL